ncbi:MAG: GNAT family N-acetyltransferase [Blastocatellia bacterium]|nr:GNAT family N-acetyltransferase [Blastocatellia bacterium]
MNKLIETERLYLRMWSLDDASRLFEICSNPEVMQHIGNRKPYQSIAEAEEFLNWVINYQKINGFCRWAVIEKKSETIVGSCGLAERNKKEIELGYLFAREVWGKGYATEAAKGCVKYGFETLGIKQMIGLTDVNHTASQNVLKKAGFVFRRIESDGNQGKDVVYEIFNQV